MNANEIHYTRYYVGIVQFTTRVMVYNRYHVNKNHLSIDREKKHVNVNSLLLVQIITRIATFITTRNIPVWWACRHLSFRRLERVLQYSFSPYLLFLINANPQRIHSNQIRQLSCHTRETRAHWLLSHLPFRMDDFVHECAFSFWKSIDWWVQYKNNPTLDLLIKYVA